MLITKNLLRCMVFTAIALFAASPVSESLSSQSDPVCDGCVGISYGVDLDQCPVGSITIVIHPSDGLCVAETCQAFSCEHDIIQTWNFSNTQNYTYVDCTKYDRKWNCSVTPSCCVSGLGQLTISGAFKCGTQVQALFTTAGMSVTAAADCTVCEEQQ